MATAAITSNSNGVAIHHHGKLHLKLSVEHRRRVLAQSDESYLYCPRTDVLHTAHTTLAPFSLRLASVGQSNINSTINEHQTTAHTHTHTRHPSNSISRLFALLAVTDVIVFYLQRVEFMSFISSPCRAMCRYTAHKPPPLPQHPRLTIRSFTE